MARYIDTDKLERLFDRESFHTPDERWRPESEFAFFIDYAETEDVAPVIHAHWSMNKEYVVFVCSNCGKSPTEGTGYIFDVKTLKGRNYNYCRYCGAKMDEEVDA